MARPCALVIRQDDRFSRLLRDAGFEVLNLELIRTAPLEDLSELDAKLERIGEYDGMFFTSPAAAEAFVARTGNGGHFRGKMFVLGERARAVLEKAGFDVVSVDAANTADEMLETLGTSRFAGGKYLFVRGTRSMRTIPELLGSKAVIDEAIVYRTAEVPPAEAIAQEIRNKLNAGDIDWICFFSPSGVESFLRHFGSEASAAPAAAIGETTARAARKAGMNVRFISPRSNAENFAQGLTAEKVPDKGKLKSKN